MPFPSDDARDRPWLMRTYAGHSSAQESNKLYRRNLSKGQTGLSVAFDLPTQTGYDPDARAGSGRGRQGRRAGLPPRRHARRCSTSIPVEKMNTSMTINAPADVDAVALPAHVAEEQGADFDRRPSRARPRTT